MSHKLVAVELPSFAAVQPVFAPQQHFDFDFDFDLDLDFDFMTFDFSTFYFLLSTFFFDLTPVVEVEVVVSKSLVRLS